MKKYSSQSSSNQDGNFAASFFQPPPMLGAEVQGDEFNFREYLGIARRRALVIVGVAAAVMGFSVYSASKQQPEYEGHFRLLVEPLNQEMTLQDLTSGQSSSLSQSSLDYESQIQVLKSPQLIKEIAEDLQKSYPNVNYDSLANGLTIIRLGETKILEVRYRSDNPTQVKDILDKVSQAYLDYSLERRQTSLRQGLRFVEKQLTHMQQRVDQLQRDLQIFRQKNNFTDPENQAQQVESQVQSTSEQRAKLNQSIAVARAKLANLQDKTGEVAALRDAASYQQLVTLLRQLDVQMATELTRFQDDSPNIQTLKDKRERLLPLLRQEVQRFLNTEIAKVKTDIQILEVENQELAKVEQNLEQQRKQLPVLTRRYTELQRRLQIATESLNRFLTTRETLQIQVAQAELPWQLIQAPNESVSPIAADAKRSMITGLLLSLISGIGVALLLEKFDDTYHSIDALKKKIKQPLLGNIPFEKQLQNHPSRIFQPRFSLKVVPDSISKRIPRLITLAEQPSGVSSPRFLEALRVLHTNIQLLSSDHPIRSIVISSATSGDGKSTVAFHLAQIATAMGHRVLLVDADLRQPTIHTLSDLNNQWGLSNLISSNLPLTEAIRQPSFMSQLSILTAGPTPPDPTKLLSSEKMKRLMEDFHSFFDLVIYDTTPLLGLADASLLAPHTDGILLVVRMDQTSRGTLKRALDSLKLSRMNVLGIVGNGQKSGWDDY